MNFFNEISSQGAQNTRTPSQSQPHTLPQQPKRQAGVTLDKDAPTLSSGGQKKAGNKNTILVLVASILTVAAGTLGYLYYQEKQEADKPAEKRAKEEVAEITAIVSKLVAVPEGETPSLATVVDSAKLKKSNPLFYAGVEDGDKLLVYSSKVILYDNSDEVVLNMVSVDPDKKNTADTVKKDGDVSGETTDKVEDPPEGTTEK